MLEVALNGGVVAGLTLAIIGALFGAGFKELEKWGLAAIAVGTLLIWSVLCVRAGMNSSTETPHRSAKGEIEVRTR